MGDRWSILIDIEGFSALWGREDRVLWSLGELMRAIFRVGCFCYPREPDRLFAHQLGDGFLIASDLHEESLDRCAAIAVALMRHVAHSGRLAKCAIAEGELSDIQSCYPDEVLAARDSDRRVSLNKGLMTIFPVMGTALIRAVSTAKVSPKGPLVTVHAAKRARLSGPVPCQPILGSQLISIDWVHMSSGTLQSIQDTASLAAPSPAALEYFLDRYCAEHEVPAEWTENVRTFLHVPRGSGST